MARDNQRQIEYILELVEYTADHAENKAALIAAYRIVLGRSSDQLIDFIGEEMHELASEVTADVL